MECVSADFNPSLANTSEWNLAVRWRAEWKKTGQQYSINAWIRTVTRSTDATPWKYDNTAVWWGEERWQGNLMLMNMTFTIHRSLACILLCTWSGYSHQNCIVFINILNMDYAMAPLVYEKCQRNIHSSKWSFACISTWPFSASIISSSRFE